LASIIKLNEAEAEKLFELAEFSAPYSVEAFCKSWSSNYGGAIICVTLGSQGCAVWQDGHGPHLWRLSASTWLTP
jgi:fructokinase